MSTSIRAPALPAVLAASSVVAMTLATAGARQEKGCAQSQCERTAGQHQPQATQVCWHCGAFSLSFLHVLLPPHGFL
jgi:hypothetical protein